MADAVGGGLPFVPGAPIIRLARVPALAPIPLGILAMQAAVFWHYNVVFPIH